MTATDAICWPGHPWPLGQAAPDGWECWACPSCLTRIAYDQEDAALIDLLGLFHLRRAHEIGEPFPVGREAELEGASLCVDTPDHCFLVTVNSYPRLVERPPWTDWERILVSWSILVQRGRWWFMEDAKCDCGHLYEVHQDDFTCLYCDCQQFDCIVGAPDL